MDDGSNYTTISNNADHDTIDELFAAVNTWAAGVGAGTFSGLSDTTIAAPAAGHIPIHDGIDSWDNKAMSGDATISGAGALTIANNAVTMDKLDPTRVPRDEFPQIDIHFFALKAQVVGIFGYFHRCRSTADPGVSVVS